MSVKYQDFKIIFTVFLLWFSVQFGSLIEDSIAYLLVLTLGIIHGANDLLILKRKEKSSNAFIKSVLGYLILIAICVVSFFVSPFISLLLFVVLSGYHFGEQHFEDNIEGPNWLKLSIYLVYGLLLFLMIFYTNLSEVNLIVTQLSNNSFDAAMLEYLLVITSIVLISFAVFAQVKEYFVGLNLYKELFSLLLLFLVFKTASLIFGFAIYFIFWHSIPSIMDQTKYISGEVSKGSFLRYFKKASWMWVLSISGLVVLYFYLDKVLFSSAIFLILFAVTAPHTWVMYRMKKIN